jgi:hypothetical protein
MPTNAVANRNTTDVVNKFVIDMPILPSACSGCLVDWAAFSPNLKDPIISSRGRSGVIRKGAWPVYITSSGGRLHDLQRKSFCWELEEPKGPIRPGLNLKDLKDHADSLNETIVIPAKTPIIS